MRTIEETKQIIIDWGDTLPFSIRLHLFGSVLKGETNPSDVDILFEFLEESYLFRKEQRLRESLWIELNKEWETSLTKKLGMKAHLTLHRNDNKYIQSILKKGTLVIYNSRAREDGQQQSYSRI